MRSWPSIALAALAASLSVLVSACSGISDPSKNTMVDFVDSIDPLQGRVYEFDVGAKNGEYTATFTAMAPDPSTLVGIYLGQVVSGFCTQILGQRNDTAILGRIALNSTITKGHYCIQVYDVGLITRTETYTLHVSHP